VIDGLYRDPEAVRACALRQTEWTPRRAFPGEQAIVEVDTSRLYARLLEWIEIEDISPESECHGRAVFSTITRKDRDLPPMEWGLPHFDPHSHIAGLAYLNLPAQCRGGTAFYRHRRTGLERWPADDEALAQALDTLGIRAAGLSPTEAANALAAALFKPRSEPGFIRESTEDWELTALVEMRWNRAVFYETALFHSAYTRDDFFGDRLDTQRLTQTFFLRAS
jgi:hypothetical protein